MSAEEISTDVVVVGSGIAGALVATGLARQGVKVAMIEAGPRVDRSKAVLQQQNSLVRDIPEAPYPEVAYAPKPSTLDPKHYLVQ